MSPDWSLVLSVSFRIACTMVFLGCGPRMNIVTSTSLGLHATPGDGSSQPPQVSIAYKRSEVAVIPAGGGGGVDVPDDDSGSTTTDERRQDRDLFSAITAYGFQTQWFGKTALDSVIATGHAARMIASPPPASPLPQPSPHAAASLTRSAEAVAASVVTERAVEPGSSFIEAMKSVTR